MKRSLSLPVIATLLTATLPAQAQQAGNVIFFHPDGTGVNHWTAARMHTVGPDGTLNWDKLPALGVYKGHMADRLTGTSHGGATVHAYGVKVKADSFGMNGGGAEAQEITAASGKKMTIAEEALAAGKAVALVQTGHIAEPGTAVFAASVDSRKKANEIAEQVINSGIPVILAGGERHLIPQGSKGVHGRSKREDDKNLIEAAKEKGYTVVYNRDELLALDTSSVDKVLGVFASKHTFNDQEAERNLIDGKPTYKKDAPTIAEMAKVALEIISRDEDGFFAVIEEEGTDNIPNNMNGGGTLEALARVDEAVGLIHGFVNGRDDTMLIMAADSDAAGMQVINGKEIEIGEAVPAVSRGGGIVVGQQGRFGDAFVSAPDKNGVQHPFGIAFTGYSDVAGGILVRAAGVNTELVTPLMDNTDVYKVMYTTLFGTSPAN